MLVSLDKIESAFKNSRDSIRLTPLFRSLSLERKIGSEHPIYLKAENLQHTGSFKLRGALSKILSIYDSAKKNGIVTASAGNHAQGVAFHANRLGLDAKIVMPIGTPMVKVARTKEKGADVIFAGESYQEAYHHAKELQKLHGYEYVHAFDDEEVMAGQGTLALEVLQQCPDISVFVAPIGGGGLLAGCASYFRQTKKEVKLIGVQASGSNNFLASREKGSPITLEKVSTIAEGMAVKKLGDKTFEILNAEVDEAIVVNDEEISEGLLWILENERLFVEGCGGATLAAVFKNPEIITGPTVVLLSGGNLDVNLLARIIDRGLARSGRRVKFEARIADVPGALEKLIHVLAEARASIIEIDHERVFSQASVKEVNTHVEVETEGPEHVERLREALQKGGWPIRFL